MDALDLLTYDCWMEVLLRVKAAEDLKSCSEVCLTFQDILRKKRNQFLFSLILPQVLEYFHEEDVDDDSDDEEQHWNALLKCRLVCKSWRRFIDEYCEDVFEDVFEDAYDFYSGERIEEFLQHFATHAGNPFIVRSVELPLRSPLPLAGNQVEDLGDPEETFEVRKLRELLERFGREIWKLRLFDQSQNEHMAFCKNLQAALSHLSNLRTLTLWCHMNGNTINNQFNQEQQAELTSYIAANPLPALPQLEHLEAFVVNGTMKRLLFEKYAPTLKSLIVGDPTGFPEHGSIWRNLRKLEFYQVDASTSLNCLGQLRSPLTILRLVVSQNRFNVDVWPIDTLFRNIRHLPIERLDITVVGLFLGESGPIPAENRPFHESISSVKLTLSDCCASLNFLLYCPKLEFIKMYRSPPRPRMGQGIPTRHPDGVAESLDVNGLLGQVGYDLYDSTIWEHLSSLKSFKLRNYVGGDVNWGWRDDAYVRGEYERRKLERGGVGG